MKNLCFSICLLFNLTLFSQNPIALEALQGKWHIHFTNFPLWLKGNKTQPTFNYSIAQKGGVLGLKDSVIYVQKGKKKSIVGFDKPVNTSNTQFVWRGQGLLSLLKSEWQLIYVDPTTNWAIIGFKKTLFTPAGYDVVSKNEAINSEIRQAIEAKLKELKIFNLLKII